MRLRLLLVLILLCGCISGEKQIANSSIDVAALSRSSKQRFEIIYLEAGKPLTDTRVIQSEALSGSGEQDKIIEAVNSIIRALPEVQNIANPWIALIINIGYVCIFIGVLVLLFQTGFIAWIRGIFRIFTRRDKR